MKILNIIMYFDCEKAINIIKKFITIDNTNYTNYTT